MFSISRLLLLLLTPSTFFCSVRQSQSLPVIVCFSVTIAVVLYILQSIGTTFIFQSQRHILRNLYFISVLFNQ